MSSCICKRHDIIIRYMETDRDHIHYMMELPPTISVSKVVMLVKSYTTYWIWQKLGKEFLAERTFWTDGYFACCVGNVSEAMLAEYIKNQG